MKSKKEIGLDFIKNNINNFICPYCKNSIELNETSLKCHSKHTFDLTKQGTINILNKILGNYNYCAFDYSKSAINLASDYNSTNRFYFDGDVNNIPITTNSIDVIIDFLSPYSESEVKRVLKKGGMFIKVSPNKDYLLELRQALGLNEYQKQAKVIDNLAKHFKNISTKTYTKSFAISKEDQDNLIGMTPINTTQNSLEIPSITIDLNIYIIQN